MLGPNKEGLTWLTKGANGYEGEEAGYKDQGGSHRGGGFRGDRKCSGDCSTGKNSIRAADTEGTRPGYMRVL